MSTRPWKPPTDAERCEDHIAKAVAAALVEGIKPEVIGATMRRFTIAPDGGLIDWSQDPRDDPEAPPKLTLKVVRAPETQLRLPLEPAWKPTPRQARRSRPKVRTCRSREQTWTQQELFPATAEIAAMVAALAARFTTWSSEEAS